MNRQIKFEYGFESVNGIVKKVYYLHDIPNIKNKCDVWDILPLKYVRQFTGLTDKNGKECYEGDNLKLIADNGQSYGNYEVKQDLSSEYGIDFYLKRHDLTFNWGRLSRIKELMWNCEVIGNIFENK